MNLTKNPKISIILCSYNEKDRLQKTVDSILENTDYENYEIIVVDNRSLDDSFAFITQKKYALHPKIIPVQNLENLGVSKGRASGFPASNGEILVFMDAHMEVHPGWCQKIIKNFQSKKNIGGLSVHCYDLSNPSSQKNSVHSVYSRSDIAFVTPTWVGSFPFKRTKKIPFVNGGVICISKVVYEEIGGFFPLIEKWGHDDTAISLLLYFYGYNSYLDHNIPIGHFYKKIEDNILPEELEKKKKQIEGFPKTIYNSLALSYVLLDQESFDRVLEKSQKYPDFEQNYALFLEKKKEIDAYKMNLEQKKVRGYENFKKEFFPFLTYIYTDSLERAKELSAQKKMKEAEKYFQKAKKMPYAYSNVKKEAFDLYIDWQRSKMYFGEEKEMSILMDVVQKNPFLAFVHKRVGDAFCHLKKYDIALFWYQNVEKMLETIEKQKNKLNESEFKDIDINLWDMMALVFYYLKDYKNAVKYAKKAIEKKPDDERMLKNLKLYEQKLKEENS